MDRRLNSQLLEMDRMSKEKLEHFNLVVDPTSGPENWQKS